MTGASKQEHATSNVEGPWADGGREPTMKG
jgi:hypothetical protein